MYTKELAFLHPTFQCDDLKGLTMNVSAVEVLFSCLFLCDRLKYMYERKMPWNPKKRLFRNQRWHDCISGNNSKYSIIQACLISSTHLSEATRTLGAPTTGCNPNSTFFAA